VVLAKPRRPRRCNLYGQPGRIHRALYMDCLQENDAAAYQRIRCTSPCQHLLERPSVTLPSIPPRSVRPGLRCNVAFCNHHAACHEGVQPPDLPILPNPAHAGSKADGTALALIRLLRAEQRAPRATSLQSPISMPWVRFNRMRGDGQLVTSGMAE